MRVLARWTAAAAVAAMALALPAVVSADEDKPKEKETAQTPEEAWAQFQKAVAKGDKERLWALLSKDSQKAFEEEIGSMMKSAEGEHKAEMAKELGVTEEEFEKMTEKDLCIAMLIVMAKKDDNDLQKMKVSDVKVDGDKAAGLRDEKGTGKKEDAKKAYFIKENGEWKLDVKREMSDDGGSEPPGEPEDGDDENGEGGMK